MSIDAYKLSYVESGGFAHIDVQIDVDSAVRTISRRTAPGAVRVQAELTPAELASITAALGAANIAMAGGPYRCGRCVDQLIFDLALETGGALHTVHWEEGSQAPPELFDLGRMLRHIAAQKFLQP